MSMKSEQLNDSPGNIRPQVEYIPLIADKKVLFSWGIELGQQARYSDNEVVQDNTLFRLSFRAWDKTFQFTDLSPSDYTVVRSWLAGELENNKSSLSPLAGALTGLALGLAASEFKTRGQFIRNSIRTAGLTVAGAALSSCAPGERISSQTDALLQTATAIHMGEITPSPEPVTYRTPSADTTVVKTEEGYTISTITPELTPSPTLTVMEVLKEVEVAIWAEDDAGNIDPDILYPIVGSVHNANKRTVDLTDKSSGLKLAVILGEDTNMEDANLKQEIADQLNNQEELKSQIEEINNQLPENEKKSAIIVINGEALNSNQAEVTQIAIRSNLPIEKRYLLENGTLRQMTKEEEPLLMPPLSAPDHRFIRTDTGEQVMLRGANILYFTFGPEAYAQRELLNRELEALKYMGGNYVVFNWNSGFVADPDYVSRLVKALEYAKNVYGFRVTLDLTIRGLGDQNDPYSGMAKQILTVDEQLIEDWKTLLKDKDIALRIGKVVDVFTVVGEPVYNAQGGRLSLYDPILSQTCNTIRSAVNNPKAICAFSGGEWGWASDATELIGKEWTVPESTINLHPYRGMPVGDISPNILDYAKTLQNQEVNLSIGEFGWEDWEKNLEYVKKGLQFFEDNHINYSVWGLLGGYEEGTNNSGDRGVLLIGYDPNQIILSPVGEYMKEFWSQFNNQN